MRPERKRPQSLNISANTVDFFVGLCRTPKKFAHALRASTRLCEFPGRSAQSRCDFQRVPTFVTIRGVKNALRAHS